MSTARFSKNASSRKIDQGFYEPVLEHIHSKTKVHTNRYTYSFPLEELIRSEYIAKKAKSAVAPTVGWVFPLLLFLAGNNVYEKSSLKPILHVVHGRTQQ